MSASKRLTKKQTAVMEDLFAGELNESAILRKHEVKPREYERWLANERFAEQLEQRIAAALRRGRMTLARNASNAATKLIELTRSDKGETARKACLDILGLQDAGLNLAESTDSGRSSALPAPRCLSPEAASRLLAALAKDDSQ